MIAKGLQASFEFAVNEAVRRRHEYVTLEHLLYALLHDRLVVDVIRACGGDLESLKTQLDQFIDKTYDRLEEEELQPTLTTMLQRVIQYAQLHAQSSGQKEVDTGQMLAAIYHAEKSQSVFPLRSTDSNLLTQISSLLSGSSACSMGTLSISFFSREEASTHCRMACSRAALSLLSLRRGASSRNDQMRSSLR